MALFNNSSRLIAGCVLAVICVFALALYITDALGRHANAETQIKLGTSQNDAAWASGRDAAGTVATSAADEAAIDATTLENDRAIRSAPGADAPVDPALARAGLYGLCQRSSYSGDQRCLQFTPSR